MSHDEPASVTDEIDRSLDQNDRSLIERARGFAERVVAPNARQWEHERRMPVHALREACTEGLGGMEIARAAGGLGAGFVARARALEEIARHDGAFAFSLSNHHSAAHRIAGMPEGSSARALLAPMLRGELIGCTALTDENAGSDFSAIRTRARKVPGGWLLSGHKTWITNAAGADVILTYAQTADDGSPNAGARGIGCFVVRAADPGFEREPAYALHGAHAIGAGGFVLRDHFVADDMVMSPPGEAFRQAMGGLNRARVQVPLICTGMVDAALAQALDYGERRAAFGRPLLDHQGLRWSLVDVAAELEAMRLLAYRGARLIASGHDARLAAAVAKKYANERALGAIAACMHAMGANGLRAEHPLARHLACAKVFAYTDGTPEMMNERIGQLLRAPARPS